MNALRQVLIGFVFAVRWCIWLVGAFVIGGFAFAVTFKVLEMCK